MNEQRNPRAVEMSAADARTAKVIFFSTLFIGGVLLVALALPNILERF